MLLAYKTILFDIHDFEEIVFKAYKILQVNSKDWRNVRQAAIDGKIANLRLMIISVQSAPRDAKKR